MEAAVAFGLFGTTKEEAPVPVPLVGVRAEADIVGGGARVDLTQTFENREAVAVEAVYRFPLPESAALTGFRARVGDRVVTGRVEERDRAFDEYDRAMEEGHGAFLLDQERPNVFTLSVGNLPPGGRAEITLTYVEVLEADGTDLRFRLPTTISPRYVPGDMDDEDGVPPEERVHPPYADEVPYGLTLEIRVHGRDALEALESPTHPVRVAMEGDPVRVEFAPERAAMDRDFVLTVRRREGLPSAAWLVEGEGEAFVQADLVLPRDDAQDLPHEIVFLLDCSGSMMGSSIEQAKRALRILLRALPAGVRTNLYRFGSTHEAVWPEPRPADPKAVEELVSRLDAVDADLGGTEILRPLREIVERPLPGGARRDVILLTDGEVANERAVAKVAGSYPGRVRVFAVGIGHGPNDFLIRETARVSGGASAVVAPGERIEPRVLGLFGKVLGASVTGLRIKGVQGLEQAPREATGFSGGRVVLFGRCPAGAVGPELRVAGRAGEASRTWTLPVKRVSVEAAPIPQLWAREAIRDLEAGVGGGSRQGRRKEGARRAKIVELSTRYGLASSYASFVAVETRPETERHTGEIALRKVPVLVTTDWHGRGLTAPAAGPVAYAAAPAGIFGLGRFLLGGAGRAAVSAPEAFGVACEGSDRFDRPPSLGVADMAASYESADEDSRLVYELLDLQRPEGGFEIRAGIAKQLGWDRRALDREARAAAPSAGDEAVRLLWTLIVLSVLENRFADRTAEWAAVVEKSRRWLKERLAALPPGEAEALKAAVR
ncbi:VIT domain-containing protein [Deferrisoma palaeochoriense]